MAMTDMGKHLHISEKRVYIQSLAYILKDKKEDFIKDYLLTQMAEYGIAESEYNSLSVVLDRTHLAKKLNKISDIRTKRYIVREMILLAVADHELNDQEIDELSQFGKDVGICEEKMIDFFMWAARGIEWQLDGTKLVEEDL